MRAASSSLGDAGTAMLEKRVRYSFLTPKRGSKSLKALRTALCLLSLSTALISFPAFSTLASADSQNTASYKLKAAFILNFLRFTKLPQEPEDEIQICVVGSNEIKDVFSLLEKKSIRGKSLNVSLYNRSEACNVIFVPTDQNTSLPLESLSALSIGEGVNSLEQGCMVRFFEEQDKLRFEVNLERVRTKGLNMSSKLLKLAKIYEGS